MKKIMFLIEEKKQEFAKLPLFQFMQDKKLATQAKAKLCTLYGSLYYEFW